MLGLTRSLRSLSSIPVWGVLASVAAPGDAKACEGDPCEGSNRIHEFLLLHDQAKPEGVLVFDAVRAEGDNGLSLEGALGYADVQVLDPDGVAIEGTLEAFDDRFVLWRPASPLAPDATYTVLGTVDNDTLGLEHDAEGVNESGWCGPNLAFERTVETTSGSFSSLQVSVSVTEDMSLSAIRNLDTMVCCDGAMPYVSEWCLDAPLEFSWDEGYCTVGTERGQLRATFDVESPSLDESELANIVLRLHTGSEVRRNYLGDFSISHSALEPSCSTVELVNLATGQSVSSEEICVGEDVADQLGWLPLDISDVLAEECAGEAYVCEVNGDGDRWDPESCGPWAESEDGDGSGGEGDGGEGSGSDGGADDGGLSEDGIADRGCGCRARSGSSGWGLAWGVLGLVLWRRRRR